MKRFTGEKCYVSNQCGKASLITVALDATKRFAKVRSPICKCRKTFIFSYFLQCHRMIQCRKQCYVMWESLHSSRFPLVPGRVSEWRKSLGCKLCTNTLYPWSKLWTHEYEYTADKQYGCQKCGKAFSCSASLWKHVKSHNWENL